MNPSLEQIPKLYPRREFIEKSYTTDSIGAHIVGINRFKNGDYVYSDPFIRYADRIFRRFFNTDLETMFRETLFTTFGINKLEKIAGIFAYMILRTDIISQNKLILSRVKNNGIFINNI